VAFMPNNPEVVFPIPLNSEYTHHDGVVLF
jgi:hypothetical protein